MKAFIKTGFIMLLISISPPALAEIVEPKIDLAEETVELGPSVTAALRAWKLDFRLYKPEDYMAPARATLEHTNRGLPMALMGNFNGDGIADIVLMGHTADREIVVLVNSNKEKGKYEVFEVTNSPAVPNPRNLENNVGGAIYFGLDTYLSLVPANLFPAGPLVYANKGAEMASQIDRARDGFQIEVFLSAATTSYVFDGKKVVPYTGRLKRI